MENSSILDCLTFIFRQLKQTAIDANATITLITITTLTTFSIFFLSLRNRTIKP